MQKFLDQAKHNWLFIKDLESSFPVKYFDWKITITFYTALNLAKYYIKFREQKDKEKLKKLGITSIEIEVHEDIKNAIINKNGKQGFFPVSQDCWNAYNDLKRLSETRRYDGFNDSSSENQQILDEYENASQNLELIMNYFRNKHNINVQPPKAVTTKVIALPKKG